MAQEKFGRYEIIEEIGRGGMATVFHAHDPRFKRDVAVKVLPREFMHDPTFKARFEREGQTIGALEHPAIVPVHDFGEEEGQPYLVMRYMTGGTLADRLEDGPVKLNEASVIMKRLCSGLDHAHSQGVIHRDLKPANIIFDPFDNAYLVDFGIAQLAETTAKLTGTSSVVGTPSYMSPEQVQGEKELDGRSDIYTLGIILFEMITGEQPYMSDTPAKVMMKHILEPTPRVVDVNPDLPRKTQDVIDKALAKDPDNRYQTASAFADAMDDLVNQATTLPGTVIEPSIEGIDVVPPAAPTVVRRDPAPAVPPPPPAQAPPPIAQPASQPISQPVPKRRRITCGILVAAVIGVGLIVALIGGGAGVLSLLRNATPFAGVVPPVVTQADEPSATPETLSTSIPEGTTLVEIEETTLPLATPLGGGGQIAFVSNRTSLPQIYIKDIGGGQERQLTTGSSGACQPAWSPNGELLAYISPCLSRSDTHPQASIFVMEADGTGSQQILTPVSGAFDLDWSEAGIVFTNFRDNRPRIWVVNPDGTGARQISPSQSADRQPTWSPAGDRLVFMNTSRAGTPTLYWMFADGTFPGSNPDQVTRDQLVSFPDWSPNGDLVAYVVDSQIYLVKWDERGFGVVQLTNVLGNAGPAWSPDGRWLAFESWRTTGNHDIYILTASGGEITQITNDPAEDFEPAWRP